MHHTPHAHDKNGMNDDGIGYRLALTADPRRFPIVSLLCHSAQAAVNPIQGQQTFCQCDFQEQDIDYKNGGFQDEKWFDNQLTDY